VKQGRLVQALKRLGGVAPETLYPPVERAPWGYRRKARLAARYVARKGGVLVGFRERHGSYVADLRGCEVLVPGAGRLIPALRELVSGMSIRDRVPQLEVAAGDGRLALVLRHLAPLSTEDRRSLVDFARREEVELHLQPGGLDTVAPLWPEAPEPLSYALAEFDVEIQFLPTDFVQVNGPVNEALVARVVELLALEGGESVLDLFCGVGNFTLPLARHAAEVAGVEGSAALVARARENARRNGLARVDFETADLFDESAAARWWDRPWDRVLLDPPRAGASDLVKGMRAPHPRRLVYVSCQPATLARDAGVLVGEHGYRLAGAGIVDMFPHTNHIETVALFVHD
jgi:23S rRNA (uracil1939-C5)-methyltransferase